MSIEDKLISCIFSDNDATRVALAMKRYHDELSRCHPDHRDTISEEIYTYFYGGGGYDKNVSQNQGVRYAWVERLAGNDSESDDWNF